MNWKPIRNFNAKVLTSGSDDLIYPGVKIIIPRTNAEYDETIARLKNLLGYVDRDKEATLKEMQQNKANTDRRGAQVDIAADIIFAGKGAAKGFLKYGGKVRKVVMRKHAYAAATSAAIAISNANGLEGVVLKSTGSAISDSSIFQGTRRHGRKLQSNFKKSIAQSVTKMAVTNVARAIAPLEKANGFAAAVDAICSIAIGGIEAVSPSKVAKFYVWIRTGEHQDDTYNNMQRVVKKGAIWEKNRLKEAIKKLTRDQKLVYG